MVTTLRSLCTRDLLHYFLRQHSLARATSAPAVTVSLTTRRLLSLHIYASQQRSSRPFPFTLTRSLRFCFNTSLTLPLAVFYSTEELFPDRYNLLWVRKARLLCV